MRVNCSARDEAEGLDALIKTLTWYQSKNLPDLRVEVLSDSLTQRHILHLNWTEER